MEQKNKLFRNALFAGMALFAFTACSNDDDPSSNVFNKEYKLVEVEWTQMVDDEITSRAFDEVKEIVATKSSVDEYSAEFLQLEDYQQTSQFLSDDPELFKHLTGTTPDMIFIPFEGFSTIGTYYHITGGNQAPFSLDAYNYPSSERVSQKVSSKAQFVLRNTSTIEETRMSATYRAYFKEVDGDDKIEITGKWKGVFYSCTYSMCSTTDFKE